jgi:Methylase involved in ubiquinone/menaquinone biosynthesis
MNAPTLRPEILAYYDRGHERDRLLSGRGVLEFVRTQEILRRVLPAAPARIADIGGGAGIHASWLARDGNRVTIVEPVGLHVRQAIAASADQPDAPFDAVVGDARDLPLPDASCDAALLLGPLYHLPDRDDRIAALVEARRIVRRGGVIVAGAITRFGTWLDALLRDLLLDPEFRAIAERDLRDGQHRAVEGRWFTTSFFHHPDDLIDECREAGLDLREMVAVEGPSWFLPDLPERLADPVRRDVVLEVVRAIEHEPSLMGASGHFVAVASVL